ncbi:MAG: glycosyltransferase family 4 protein [Candidatus Omnitrophota bacterium]
MNILILTNHLNIGGITRYVLSLSYGLKKRGHRVFVGSLPGWSEKLLKENGIVFLRLPLKTKSIFSLRQIFSYIILKRFIRKENIGLIHAQTRITQFLAFVLSKRLNIPYVCTFHGFYRAHLMRRRVSCLGDLTIAISQAVGRHLINDFNLDERKLRVVYNSAGLEPASLLPCSEEAGAKDFTSFKGSPTIGIIARLSEEKGHLFLFRAFSRLIKDYPNARLLVAGSGKKERELKDWAQKENLSNRIIFLGNVTELGSLFEILDVSVLPSTLEGLGFSVLEAQANGVPVVASCVGGITEIIKDRATGILVKPADVDNLYQGISLILKDALLREGIINNAKKQIKERFGLEGMIIQIESVYKEAVKGSKKR